MGYEEVWRMLADLLKELRNKDETIPANVMNDLRSAKTMIQILKADPTHTENIPRIETYVENVESHLIAGSQENFGAEYVKQWMKKLEKARRRVDEKEETAPRFVSGIPRGKEWVRVQVSKATPQSTLEALAKENRLSLRRQDDGYVLVYGRNENIRAFLKKLGEKFPRARKP